MERNAGRETDVEPGRLSGPGGATDPGARSKTGDLTVGQVAALVGISVRALHHWDEIGLVTPSARTVAGYRLYGSDDLTRIHTVLIYREIGMPLARIAQILDDPDADAGAHLTRQRSLLADRISRLTRMLRAVDTMLEKETMGENTSAQERADLLGTYWAQEAEARWGDTEEWVQAAERKAAMTPADWDRVRSETDVFEAALVAAKRDGVEPGSERANALAERHRASIDQWFDTTYSKHVIVGCGYVADRRFTEYYDKLEPGLATWLKAIIDANAAAHGVDPATVRWE